jgi:hypothetical protein
MTDDFDWCGDDDCIVVPSQPAIAVYLNSNDAVMIRQKGHYGLDEDQFVYITKVNVPKVVQALLEAAGYETATTYGEPLMPPKPEPPSGAERQKRYRNKRNGNGDASVTENGDAPLPTGTKHEVLIAAE